MNGQAWAVAAAAAEFEDKMTPGIAEATMKREEPNKTHFLSTIDSAHQSWQKIREENRFHPP